MTKVSIPAEFERWRAAQLPFLQGLRVNPDALLRRMEHVSSGHANRGAPRPAVHLLDAALLVESETLEATWRYEVAALTVMKNLNTPEAAAIARRARAATEAVVRRIEAAKARTPAGRQVKDRALLWRRNGEPLEDDVHGTVHPRDARTGADISWVR
jgi:hypothetical protein